MAENCATVIDLENACNEAGELIRVALWYPRLESAGTIEVGLYDVRAADSIRVQYDFDRDGWVILQASTFEWAADEEPDSDWQEVAFIQAWAREDRKGEPEVLPDRKAIARQTTHDLLKAKDRALHKKLFGSDS